VAQLLKLGFAVRVESGAGSGSNFSDDSYRQAGATGVSDTRELWSGADIILKVRPPARHPQLNLDEIDLLRDGQVLISFLWPAQNPDLLDRLSKKGVTTLAMDQIGKDTVYN